MIRGEEIRQKLAQKVEDNPDQSANEILYEVCKELIFNLKRSQKDDQTIKTIVQASQFYLREVASINTSRETTEWLTEKLRKEVLFYDDEE